MSFACRRKRCIGSLVKLFTSIDNMESANQKLYTEVLKDKIRNANYPKLCIIFASINLVLKLIILAMAFTLDDYILSKLFVPSDVDIEYSTLIYTVRPIIVIESLLSLFFSWLLIAGVKQRRADYLRICFVYGSIVLTLSIGSAVPQFLLTFLTAEYHLFWRHFINVVLTAVVAFEVYAVYVTYKLYRRNDEVNHLIRENSLGEDTIKIEKVDLIV